MKGRLIKRKQEIRVKERKKKEKDSRRSYGNKKELN